VALALLGLGLAAVFQVVTMQGRAQAQARLHLEALRQAQNLMDQWLETPQVRAGGFQGAGPSGMAWRVTVRQVAGEAPKTARPAAPGSPQQPAVSSARPTSRRRPALYEVAVCCSYRFMGRDKRVCLVSQRVGEGDI